MRGGETAEEQKGGKGGGRDIYRCNGRRDIATALAAPCSLHYRSRPTIYPTSTTATYLPKPPISPPPPKYITSPVLNNLDRDVADLITPIPLRIHNLYFNKRATTFSSSFFSFFTEISRNIRKIGIIVNKKIDGLRMFSFSFRFARKIGSRQF